MKLSFINTICPWAAFTVTVGAVLLSLSACRPDRRAGATATADALFQESDSARLLVAAASDSVVIRYARGLAVGYEADGVHVRISNPEAPDAGAVELVVSGASRRFICTTALQLGNFEVLGLEPCIVGMNTLRNLFSTRMKAQMASGHTVCIGKEGNFDLETVIAARPDYIFVSASKHGGFEALRDCGIPLIPHHGYKETDPLGQAEWVKLVGLLTGEVRLANAVFADIERKYLALRDEVARASGTDSAAARRRPTIVSGRQMRDGWYVVGGRSYMARLFADAGASYIMAGDDATGGRALDFESVYARGLHADFWQIDGSYDGTFTLQTLADEDPRYATMDAFRRRHVLFCNLAHTPYRELAGVQPHFLLADFVRAIHPELLPHYEPRYYRLLQ
ncbi:MAG: ABC transporter substrate-binding protein [Bacteroidaceae bacterium]|nr:ABC transporter substrate-binding protein [Bacteroidaceae bacterium]